MKNGMSDLRDHLFDVIERLKNPNENAPMDTKTAESICLVAKRLLESAEVEIQYRQLVDNSAPGSNFLFDTVRNRPLEKSK